MLVRQYIAVSVKLLQFNWWNAIVSMLFRVSQRIQHSKMSLDTELQQLSECHSLRVHRLFVKGVVCRLSHHGQW